MSLLDRYVNAVGKRLPRNLRGDIETEIRSTLEDMVEDRSRKTGLPADENMVKDVLVEYGAPDKVAAAYLPERYLIGPRLFPIFTLVLKVVFGVLAVLALIGFGIRAGTAGPLTVDSFAGILVEFAVKAFTGLISAFGNIVLVFAILQWVLPASEFEDEQQGTQWDPASLEAEPEPDRVGLWEPVWTIIFTVAAIVIFNFYPQIVGIGFFSNGQLTGEWRSVPILSAAFFSYLPWLNILWGAQIVLSLVLLRHGRWSPPSRVFNIVMNVADIALANAMLLGPSLISVTPEALQSGVLPSDVAQAMVSILGVLAQGVLIIVIVVNSVEVVTDIYRLVFRPSQSGPVIAK